MIFRASSAIILIFALALGLAIVTAPMWEAPSLFGLWEQGQ